MWKTTTWGQGEKLRAFLAFEIKLKTTIKSHGEDEQENGALV